MIILIIVKLTKIPRMKDGPIHYRYKNRRKKVILAPPLKAPPKSPHKKYKVRNMYICPENPLPKDGIAKKCKIHF